MKKTKDPCPGGKITKSAETNDIFPLKWCNHKYFHKFKFFISQSGSEVIPLILDVNLTDLQYGQNCLYFRHYDTSQN